MRERLERPAPQVEHAEQAARALSRTEVEEKYLDVLERPLGKAVEEALEARVQQLLIEHRSSPDAIREAWHGWRQALPQPEDPGVDPRVFKAVREENLAYADALRRSDPELVQARLEAKEKALREVLAELEPFAEALLRNEPPALVVEQEMPVAQEEAAARAPEARMRDDTHIKPPRAFDPVYELSQKEPPRAAPTPEELRLIRAEVEERLVRGPAVEREEGEKPVREFNERAHAEYLAAAKALQYDDPERFAPVERDLQSLRAVQKLEDKEAVEREFEKTLSRIEGADDVTQKQLHARCLALALLCEERTAPSHHRAETSETSLPFVSAELRSFETRSAPAQSPASLETLRREPAVAHDAPTRIREPETLPLDEPPTDPEPQGRWTSSLSEPEPPTVHRRSAIDGYPERPLVDEGPTAPEAISLSSLSDLRAANARFTGPRLEAQDPSPPSEPEAPPIFRRDAIGVPLRPGDVIHNPVSDVFTHRKPFVEPPTAPAPPPEDPPELRALFLRDLDEPSDPREARMLNAIDFADNEDRYCRIARRYDAMSQEQRNEFRARTLELSAEYPTHHSLEAVYDRIYNTENRYQNEERPEEQAALRVELYALGNVASGLREHRFAALADHQAGLAMSFRDMSGEDQVKVIDAAVRYSFAEQVSRGFARIDLERHYKGLPLSDDLPKEALPILCSSADPAGGERHIRMLEAQGGFLEAQKLRARAEAIAYAETDLSPMARSAALHKDAIGAHAWAVLTELTDTRNSAAVASYARELFDAREAERAKAAREQAALARQERSTVDSPVRREKENYA